MIQQETCPHCGAAIRVSCGRQPCPQCGQPIVVKPDRPLALTVRLEVDPEAVLKWVLGRLA